MTQGIKIWGPQGQTWMDSTLITWNLVEVFTVAAGAYATRSYSDLADREFLVVQIPLEVPKVDSYTYEKTIQVLSGGNIIVSDGNQIASIVVMCR